MNRASEFVGVRDNPSNPRTRSKITARAPNGSSDAVLQLIAYDSGTAYVDAPSYTADNNADSKVVTRSMLATTPTVVHTTGNETIAGNKTFSSPLTVTGTNLYMTGGAGYNNLYIQSRGVYQALRARKLTSDGTKFDSVFEIGTTYASATSENMTLTVLAPRATLGDDSETQAKIQMTLSASQANTGWIQASFGPSSGAGVNQRLYIFSNGRFIMSAPTYTDDNSADDKVVNRSMLASTPTVVHTTGAEEIAGTKTFKGAVRISDLQRTRATAIMNAGVWAKFYEYTPGTANTNVQATFWNAYYAFNLVNASMRWRGGTATSTPEGRIYNVSWLLGKIATRASDGVREVWLKNDSTSAVQLQVEIVNGASGLTALGVTGDEPVVGETYSAVADMTNQTS